MTGRALGSFHEIRRILRSVAGAAAEDSIGRRFGTWTIRRESGVMSSSNAAPLTWLSCLATKAVRRSVRRSRRPRPTRRTVTPAGPPARRPRPQRCRRVCSRSWLSCWADWPSSRCVGARSRSWDSHRHCRERAARADAV